MRPEGTIITRPDKPLEKGNLVEETKQILKRKQERRDADKARRDATPIPNWKCYPMLFGEGMPWDYDPVRCCWRDGKTKRVPKCKKCQCNIYPAEHHDCEGFVPQYEEWTEEREERWEERVRVIREMRANGWHDENDDDGDDVEDDGDDVDDDGFRGDDDGYDCD